MEIEIVEFTWVKINESAINLANEYITSVARGVRQNSGFPRFGL